MTGATDTQVAVGGEVPEEGGAIKMSDSDSRDHDSDDAYKRDSADDDSSETQEPPASVMTVSPFSQVVDPALGVAPAITRVLEPMEVVGKGRESCPPEVGALVTLIQNAMHSGDEDWMDDYNYALSLITI